MTHVYYDEKCRQKAEQRLYQHGAQCHFAHKLPTLYWNAREEGNPGFEVRFYLRMLRRVLFLLASVVLALRSRHGTRRMAFIRRDEPYLLEFSGKSAEADVKKMTPQLKKLEKKLKTRIVRFDIWNDPSAYKLFLLLDKSPRGKSLCGGLPFYYNRKTGRIVCGATTYENLENWATGQAHMLSLPPPQSQAEIEVKGRVTGTKARQARLNKQNLPPNFSGETLPPIDKSSSSYLGTMSARS